MNDAANPRDPLRHRAGRPSRRLTLRSRVRARLRQGADRVLAADLFWSALFVAAVVTILGAELFVRPPQTLVVGAAAPRDVKAPADSFRVVDDLTEERRRQARESVPDVYVHDSDRGARVAQNLGALFERGRRAGEAALRRGERDATRAIAAALEIDLSPAAVSALVERGFDPRLEADLRDALTQVLDGMIVANRQVIEDEPAIVVVRLPDGREELLTSYERLLPLARAREAAIERVRQLPLPAPAAAALGELVAAYVDTNVHYDATRTQARRDEAASGVRLVLARVQRGDLLIRKGETVSEEDLRLLEGARGASAGEARLGQLLALGFVACALAFFLWRYSVYHQRGFRKVRHLHALLVAALVSMLLVGEAIPWIARAAADNLEHPFNLLGVYAYLVPVGAGSILVALLANGRIALVYSGFLALLFGAAQGWNAHLAMWALLVQCAGVYAISAYRERAALLRAGLIVGGVGLAAALAVELLQGGGASLTRPLYAAALAFAGGALGAGLLVSFTLPLLEGLFNVLTEIRLLELSNVNNPLLAQLAVHAPGSYHHSLVVGTLAEEAAKAIGASSLFCRVAASYHDVGKINMPEYFVENQRGINPHDRLAPSMSALIIAAHVKDGIRMAREAGLPEQIVDIIPQHHGTRLMNYFYEKAKASSDPALGPVQEDEFRYPGPKPQTREAAIFMIADAVEAAARTVEDPTPNRLRDVVRKVTNTIVLEGQLDECDMTFIDLEKVQQALLRLLASMYHQRVDYPGFDFNRPEEARVAPEGAERRLVRGS